MNVLLTGGSGFVGSSFQEYYKETPYNIYAPSHKDLDLLKLSDVQSYILDNKIKYVIHTACINGRRYARNIIDDVYTNLLMFENMVVAAQPCSKLISFGAGAEFDISTNVNQCQEEDIDSIVPLEYGGFLKRIIAKRIPTIEQPKCFNLRFFGGFGPLEHNDRFIKGNLINIKQGNPIIIHQDRWFDYIYVDDLALLTQSILVRDDIPQDINCVYKDKLRLSDIANLLLEITGSNVDIVIKKGYGMESGYTGDGSLLDSLELPLIGLKEGIKETYERLI